MAYKESYIVNKVNNDIKLFKLLLTCKNILFLFLKENYQYIRICDINLDYKSLFRTLCNKGHLKCIKYLLKIKTEDELDIDSGITYALLNYNNYIAKYILKYTITHIENEFIGGLYDRRGIEQNIITNLGYNNNIFDRSKLRDNNISYYLYQINISYYDVNIIKLIYSYFKYPYHYLF